MTYEEEIQYILDHYDMVDSLMCDGKSYDEACEIVLEEYYAQQQYYPRNECFY